MECTVLQMSCRAGLLRKAAVHWDANCLSNTLETGDQIQTVAWWHTTCAWQTTRLDGQISCDGQRQRARLQLGAAPQLLPRTAGLILSGIQKGLDCHLSNEA